ncbi:hypothetical protein D4S03_08020 [bacterium]|nr:MAG: hypothetical protein D4S03_08020 [bacterium]
MVFIISLLEVEVAGNQSIRKLNTISAGGLPSKGLYHEIPGSGHKVRFSGPKTGYKPPSGASIIQVVWMIFRILLPTIKAKQITEYPLNMQGAFKIFFLSKRVVLMDVVNI